MANFSLNADASLAALTRHPLDAGQLGSLEVMARKRKYWRIVGYDSTRTIYEDKALLSCYTERDMEVLSVKGIKLVGTLPPALQGYVVYGAAVAADSSSSEKAVEFVKFLSDPGVRELESCRL